MRFRGHPRNLWIDRSKITLREGGVRGLPPEEVEELAIKWGIEGMDKTRYHLLIDQLIQLGVLEEFMGRLTTTPRFRRLVHRGARDYQGVDGVMIMAIFALGREHGIHGLSEEEVFNMFAVIASCDEELSKQILDWMSEEEGR